MLLIEACLRGKKRLLKYNQTLCGLLLYQFYSNYVVGIHMTHAESKNNFDRNNPSRAKSNLLRKCMNYYAMYLSLNKNVF